MPTGAQYCDAFGTPVAYTPLSADLAIPGHTETVSVVSSASLDMPRAEGHPAFGETRVGLGLRALVLQQVRAACSSRFRPLRSSCASR